jgi:hypothetical protein
MLLILYLFHLSKGSGIVRYFGLDETQHWTWYRRVEAAYNGNRQNTLSKRLIWFERRFMDYDDVGPNDWIRLVEKK